MGTQTRSVQVLRDDPTSSESEHIRIHLVQTEIERVRFVVRSYVRTRLYKVRYHHSLSFVRLSLPGNVRRSRNMRGT